MRPRLRASALGFMLWFTPAASYVMVDRVIYRDGPWWLWLLIVGVAFGYQPMLHSYARAAWIAIVAKELEAEHEAQP